MMHFALLTCFWAKHIKTMENWKTVVSVVLWIVRELMGDVGANGARLYGTGAVQYGRSP